MRALHAGAAHNECLPGVPLRRSESCPDRKDVAPGRWIIEATRGRQSWEIIVEPDESLKILVVITAYAV
jgi:hypothetical protein